MKGYTKAHDIEPKWPEGYEPAWFRCPECGTYWHGSEQAHEEGVAWDMAPECGPCGGIEMEELDVPGDIWPHEAIEAGLDTLTDQTP